MKRGTPDHPKMRSLARTLCVCRAHAVGILEMLWHFTANYAPEGSLAKFSPEEIAESVTWTEDPSKLVDALKKSCWLDDDMFIHDWPLHCEDSTHMRLFRANHSFACGCTPKSTRISKKEKSGSAHEEHTVCARHAHGVGMLCALPTPLPLPLPLPLPTTLSSPSAAGCDDSGKKTEGNGNLSESDLQIVDRCYEFYPRHEKPNAARKAILKALKDPQLKKLGALNGRTPIDELWMRVQEYAVYVEEHKGEFTSNGRSMIPYPASWFNAGSYLVDPTTKRHMLLEK